MQAAVNVLVSIVCVYVITALPCVIITTAVLWRKTLRGAGSATKRRRMMRALWVLGPVLYISVLLLTWSEHLFSERKQVYYETSALIDYLLVLSGLIALTFVWSLFTYRPLRVRNETVEMQAHYFFIILWSVLLMVVFVYSVGAMISSIGR